MYHMVEEKKAQSAEDFHKAMNHSPRRVEEVEAA